MKTRRAIRRLRWATQTAASNWWFMRQATCDGLTLVGQDTDGIEVNIGTTQLFKRNLTIRCTPSQAVQLAQELAGAVECHQRAQHREARTR